MALLTRDRTAAAKGSASANLRAYDLARARREEYTDGVKLERVGAEPKMTVSVG